MMNKKIRLILILLLLAVFGFSAYTYIERYLDYQKGEDLYEQAASDFIVYTPPAQSDAPTSPAPADPEIPAEIPEELVPELTMDFDKLAEVNPDIVAWIVVPNTNINYPVLQGETNDTYLRHAYNGVYRRMGSIFLDYRCSADLSDRHTIVYGHNMRNSTMFSRLLKYAEQNFYDSHRYFYIYTAEGYCKYEIFSAYMDTLPSTSYVLDFPSDASFSAFASELTGKTWIVSNVFPDGSEPIVTLSTCSSDNDDNKRFLVHGRLVEDTRN